MTNSMWCIFSDNWLRGKNFRLFSHFQLLIFQVMLIQTNVSGAEINWTRFSQPVRKSPNLSSLRNSFVSCIIILWRSKKWPSLARLVNAFVLFLPPTETENATWVGILHRRILLILSLVFKHCFIIHGITMLQKFNVNVMAWSYSSVFCWIILWIWSKLIQFDDLCFEFGQ